MIAKLEWTQSDAQHFTESHNGSKDQQRNQQQQNHRFRTDSSLSHGGSNAFYLYQIYTLWSTKNVKLAWRFPN